MIYKPPKTIIEHPAVELCDDAVALGFGYREAGDDAYRHDVGLKAGWVFDHADRDQTNMRFSSVKEFLETPPVRIGGMA